MTTICSFDVFDTCLLRKCGNSENFFDVLSIKLLGLGVDERVRQDFVAERKRAQYEIDQNPSTTLLDIYKSFNNKYTSLDAKGLADFELQVEKEQLVPVNSIKKLVVKLRNEGHKVVFISDMYLPRDFIQAVLSEHGFWDSRDSIYVSCEYGATKYSGELFDLVKMQESISFRKWHHWGDNKISDNKIPRRKGIKVHRVVHDYSPYTLRWEKKESSLSFKYSSILAGLSRALRVNYIIGTKNTVDFTLDIIAPFYCSFVYRVLADAQNRGIRKLFFCSRDAYSMFHIAQKYKDLFPQIESEYIYISKTALYESDYFSRIAYFKNIGVATNEHNVAIVDVRTSGRTLFEINKQLKENGYNIVYGYYFEVNTSRKKIYDNDCYSEVNTAYLNKDSRYSRLMSCWHIYESYFSLNREQRTIGYAFNSGVPVPIMGETDNDCDLVFDYDENVTKVQLDLLLKYAEGYISQSLFVYSNEIFSNIVIPTLCSFFITPHRYYLEPLTHIRCFNWNAKQYVPYVKKGSLVSLAIHKGRDSMWRRGTFFYNLPQCLCQKLLVSQRL